MAKAAKRASVQQAPEEGRGRAKPLPRELVRAIVGQITVTNADDCAVFVVRSQGRFVARSEGKGRGHLVELARDLFGPGGMLKRSQSAPGVWLVFK